jgi:sugar diacid utilization regulator
MKESLQELLLHIPLYQLKFLTPLPTDPIYYDTVYECIPNEWLKTPTLLMFQEEETCLKLNEKDIANQLIQDPNLMGIVIINPNQIFINEEITLLFQRCLFPIIQVEEASSITFFQQTKKSFHSFNQVSIELEGFIEKGFTQVASSVAKALGTPFLYLDEHNQLLWKTGKEDEVREATLWIHTQQNHPINRKGTNVKFEPEQPSTVKSKYSFESYSININRMVCHHLIASENLVEWQKKLMDKLSGLTALLIQREEIFQEQQEEMKEHFVYDLLYRKFESHTLMIKQGRKWGWNLDRSHHLFIIHIELSNALKTNENWMDEIILNLEIDKPSMGETLIVVPFRGQVVVLLEDDGSQTIDKRKKFALKIAGLLEKNLSGRWPQYQFYIGIGKWYQDTLNLNKSYQEAQQAITFGRKWFENKRIFHINDLGVLRLLIYIHQEILFDFSQEYLNALVESDRMCATEYIDTLKVYFQHQGITSEVSEVMHVHPNTLRNRLKKIEDITGINLQDPEEFMNLMIAVKIHSFMKM